MKCGYRVNIGSRVQIRMLGSTWHAGHASSLNRPILLFIFKTLHYDNWCPIFLSLNIPGLNVDCSYYKCSQFNLILFFVCFIFPQPTIKLGAIFLIFAWNVFLLTLIVCCTLLSTQLLVSVLYIAQHSCMTNIMYKVHGFVNKSCAPCTLYRR